jgi:non-heme chloroperoxidase
VVVDWWGALLFFGGLSLDASVGLYCDDSTFDWQAIRLVKTSTVLFLHGMWGDARFWNRFRRRFEECGHRTEAVTFLHHEKPQDSSQLRHVGMMDYVAQAERAIQAMPDAPVLVGHSMGGLVAQKLAERGLAKAMVLVAPVAPAGISLATWSSLVCISGNLHQIVLRRPFIMPWRQSRYGFLNTLGPREMGAIYRSFVHESGKAMREIVTGAIAVDERQVSCPVLVIVGSEDRATPPAVVKRIAEKYGADYREYPGRGHYLGVAWEAMDDVLDWVNARGSL